MAFNQRNIRMPFTTPQIKTWLNFGGAAFLFVILLGSLVIMANALGDSARFSGFYSLLFIVNTLAILALLFLISSNVRKLIRQVRHRTAGARLTIRLVSIFSLLSIIPVIIVYYFSVDFLHKRIDDWFDDTVEQALTDAMELSRVALNLRMKEVAKNSQHVAEELSLIDDASLPVSLNENRTRIGADELTLLKPNGNIIAHSSDSAELLPHALNTGTLLQLQNKKIAINFINLNKPNKNGLFIHVTQRIMRNRQPFLLNALFPTTERVSQLATQVESRVHDYREHLYLQQPLKISFTLILSLVLLLSLFSAIWLAFFAARRLVAPLSDLVKGTQAVASGDYEKQLPVTRKDELGFLVQSFNQMTRRIAQARDEVRQSQHVVNQQKNYLEAVLDQLSSGVISLDSQQRLRTANPAADQILGLSLSSFIDQPLSNLQSHTELHVFYSTVSDYVENATQNWHAEITVFGDGGRKVLMCRGTQLQQGDTAVEEGGHVIVFDDITTVIQAQRDEAWSEVARRLAHEIKNPLTPIQLSAERLRHKYLHKLSTEEGSTLDRLTHTIVQQVEAMKEMVNAFSDYARTPVIHKQALNLNELINEVLDLYQHARQDIKTNLDMSLVSINVDKGRFRQLLHNIIKNALEANQDDTHIYISTRNLLQQHAVRAIELCIEDNGTGIPPELLNHAFEPYVTTKTKGTGLGLAVVKKIVEEHGGVITIENKTGACLTIRLPVEQIINSPNLPSIESR